MQTRLLPCNFCQTIDQETEDRKMIGTWFDNLLDQCDDEPAWYDEATRHIYSKLLYAHMLPNTYAPDVFSMNDLAALIDPASQCLIWVGVTDIVDRDA